MVVIHDRERSWHRSVFTDSTGAIELSGLRPGLAFVTLSGAGAAPVHERVELVTAQETDLGTIDLVAGGRITVLVTPPAGLEVAVHAQILSLDGVRLDNLELAAGVGSSGPLHPGSYVLSVGGDGLASVELPCSVVDGEVTSVAVAPKLGGHAYIEVRADGVGSGERSIRWSTGIPGGRMPPRWINERHVFRSGAALLYVAGLPMGVSSVRVELPDGPAGTVSVDVRAVGKTAEPARASLSL
jgi:hypothetical protein